MPEDPKVRLGASRDSDPDIETVLVPATMTFGLRRTILEARLVGDAELAAAGIAWCQVQFALQPFDEPDADSAAARNDAAEDWRLAAAAARIGSISMHWHVDLTSSNKTARDTALGVLSSEPLSQGRILDIIEGGIGTWDESFLTAVAALTVQQPTLDISKSSLLRLTREADYRGCAAEARRLLQRLPDAKSAELSAAELASIILLSRRHQLRGLIGRCARGSAFNRDVIDLLGVEDVLWLMEHSGLSQRSLTRIRQDLLTNPRFSRMIQDVKTITSYTD